MSLNLSVQDGIGRQVLKSYPVDRSVWEKGLTVEEFIESMSEHKLAMQRRLQEVHISPQDAERFKTLKQPVHMVVLTEEWCTDCLMVLPILVKISESTSMMHMKIFVRRDWPDLREYYIEQDIHSIPVATFLDENFNVQSSFIERPVEGHRWLAQWKAAHPEIEITRKRVDISSEEKRVLLKKVTDQLLVDMELAYQQTLQSETVCEVAQLLGI